MGALSFWSGTPAPASTPGPGTSPNATTPPAGSADASGSTICRFWAHLGDTWAGGLWWARLQFKILHIREAGAIPLPPSEMWITPRLHGTISDLDSVWVILHLYSPDIFT